ncbi:hypothetical protein QYF36_014148 [Acer negundo]|nr:hypothetical protein QYF36_014148 [Acer negundo]
MMIRIEEELGATLCSYNCISLDLTVGAVAAILSQKELVASVLFTLALNHKQMSAIICAFIFEPSPGGTCQPNCRSLPDNAFLECFEFTHESKAKNLITWTNTIMRSNRLKIRLQGLQRFAHFVQLLDRLGLPACLFRPILRQTWPECWVPEFSSTARCGCRSESERLGSSID